MAPRRTNPDNILASKIDGAARRLAFDDATPSDAASELLALAGDRLDLLARAAGRTAGLWTERARYDGGVALLASGFLVRAIGTETLDGELARWVGEGRFAAQRIEREARALAAFHQDRNRPPGVR